jgi:hypothetical protein
MAPALLVPSAPVLVIALPLLPVRSAGIVVPVNYDVAETIGWPPAGWPGGNGVPAPAARDRDPHRELRRGRRHRPVRLVPPAATGIQWSPRPRRVGPPARNRPRADRWQRPGAAAPVVSGAPAAGTPAEPGWHRRRRKRHALFYCLSRRPWQDLWPLFRRLGQGGVDGRTVRRRPRSRALAAYEEPVAWAPCGRLDLSGPAGDLRLPGLRPDPGWIAASAGA